jgi:ABC-type sugar transport system, permease component
MTATAAQTRTTAARPVTTVRRRSRRKTAATVGFHTSGILISLAWFAPILVVLITSFRTFDDISANGIAGLPHSFTLSTYVQAWNQGGSSRPWSTA